MYIAVGLSLFLNFFRGYVCISKGKKMSSHWHFQLKYTIAEFKKNLISLIVHVCFCYAENIFVPFDISIMICLWYKNLKNNANISSDNNATE